MKQYKKFIAMLSAVTICTAAVPGVDSIAAQPEEAAVSVLILNQRNGEWTLERILKEIPSAAIKDAKGMAEKAKTSYTIKKKEEEKKEQEEAQKKAEEERLAQEAAQAAEEARQQEAAQAAIQAQEAEDSASWSQEGVQVSGDEQSLLAALIYCEAGNQPYEGQVAVGAVVMNRVRSGAYPNTIAEVIYQPGQFGPAMTGWLDSVLSSGGYTDTAMQAAADALAGSNPIGDCMSFGNGNWGIQIGDHYFH
ncbi:cell wall hydrolase [Mediterraneibacter massiliensis]|uniref:cell wall hydrolase n=1 Tax=Mediterraneibacter massiliensis TaxID=1720300 RepID=UPI0022E5F7DC|nr:cell wall hydrolase [Mediterraneibacter massiliensis]